MMIQTGALAVVRSLQNKKYFSGVQHGFDDIAIQLLESQLSSSDGVVVSQSLDVLTIAFREFPESCDEVVREVHSAEQNAKRRVLSDTDECIYLFVNLSLGSKFSRLLCVPGMYKWI